MLKLLPARLSVTRTRFFATKRRLSAKLLKLKELLSKPPPSKLSKLLSSPKRSSLTLLRISRIFLKMM